MDENAHVYFWQVDGGENLLCLVDASPRVLAAVQPGILIGFGGAGIVAEWVGCAPLPLQKRALPALFIERGRVFRCATDETAIDEEVEQLIQTFLGFAVDAHIHAPANGVKASPAGIEAFIFGLPLHSRSQI